MITEQEKAEIIAEVKASVIEDMKGKCIKEDTQKALSKPRNKWFSNSVGKGNTSPMYQKFGSIAYWQAWENIRKSTCLICGVGYVRQLTDDMKADEVAEKLCQFVYDLEKESGGKVNGKI